MTPRSTGRLRKHRREITFQLAMRNKCKEFIEQCIDNLLAIMVNNNALYLWKLWRHKCSYHSYLKHKLPISQHICRHVFQNDKDMQYLLVNLKNKVWKNRKGKETGKRPCNKGSEFPFLLPEIRRQHKLSVDVRFLKMRDVFLSS